MRSLSDLSTKQGHNDLYFNGILSNGKEKFFVRKVPIAALPIGNYGSFSRHTTRDRIWVQSSFNRRREVYYRLGYPAKEYERFFEPFVWVADLAKHFVDYLKVMGENNRKVTIHNFRATFAKWLRKHYIHDPDFVVWLKQHPSPDFRTAIVANLAFLYKEAIGVMGHDAHVHTLWSEIWEFNKYRPSPSTFRGQNPPTVVTQYIYDCFVHLPFGDRLEPLPISEETRELRDKLIRERHLELPSPLHEGEKHISTASKRRVGKIQPGDTISTHRDEEDSGTKWQREVSKDDDDVGRWFALVQKVSLNKKGQRVFDVIWYYRPVDTLCGVMKYPWQNELFLSDHCSCADRSKISKDEVLGVHDVDFGGNSTTTAEFFCRQTYTHEERRWNSLKEDDKLCEHRKPPSVNAVFTPGQTLLVHVDLSSAFSEPCEFMTSYQDQQASLLRFRRLFRRKETDPVAPPNELIYSNETIDVRKSRILGPCQVRFFWNDETIPTPYDRDGVGNCFFITHRQVVENGVASIVPLVSFPQTLQQGPDPRVEIPKLRGLDLFCGGGNFGRGLEDGGAIEMRWANDYDDKAIHTYMANVDPEAVNPFLGSIDDMQRLAIQGKFSSKVPRIGDVDFISGGSPCPGFSNLTNDKTTIKQRKNQSLVAAFGSSIDLYRPKYGLLENVTGIVQKKANKDQDVFSQLICAIVGLGYQTQFFFLDASQCGSPQRRSRVFLAFAAPGHVLPRRPPQTHSHPPHTKRMGLGFLPNGLSMAEREMPVATPFKFVTAQEATADLPRIGDAKPDICAPFPDHRIAIGLTRKIRTQINLIPRRPWGLNFAQAWFGMDKKQAGSGVLTAAEREAFPPDSGSNLSRVGRTSNAYGRQWPNRPISTVSTHASVGDAKQGRHLHWAEPRVLTIMEARRAQGFCDEDVLLGLPSTQYKIVGNSVAREVAVALGVVFREAWVESLRVKEAGSESGAASRPIIIDDEIISETSLVTPRHETLDSQSEMSRRPSPSTAVSFPGPPALPVRTSSQPVTGKRLQSTMLVEIFAKRPCLTWE